MQNTHLITYLIWAQCYPACAHQLISCTCKWPVLALYGCRSQSAATVRITEWTMHIFFEGLSCLALLWLPAAFARAELGGVDRGGLTWSSRGSSQKAGMYLAHSTSTSSCCFMDSHTSEMLAIFFPRMSPLITETGDDIWKERRDPSAFSATEET